MQFGDPIWEQVISIQGWGRYPTEEVVRFFIRNKAKLEKKQPSVLDIGAGIGANSWFMSKEGGRVVAFDGAPSALAKVNQTAQFFGIQSGIDTVLGDITNPKKYFHEQFDVLLDNYSLYANTYEQIIEAYKAYFDLLQDDGCFLSNCFGKKTTGFGTGERVNENTHKYVAEGALSNRGTTSFFERADLNIIFSSIGYKTHYVENIFEDRNGIIVEKLITCLGK